MIPMSAWTLTVFSILGFSFSRDHQKESARALKMGSSDAYAGAVRRHHSRRVPSAERQQPHYWNRVERTPSGVGGRKITAAFVCPISIR